ncbi:aspartate/glutamate racemase family protein [Aliamphritea ceti]|uniref:aspartate/glutamate racemase family protein n=1 Tax=Aliamphritea ceti TaxID=1524258 RepID=UPI0021C41340|nr:aspartate/glutamate racemase family protein [Aliamphritea ceti]
MNLLILVPVNTSAFNESILEHVRPAVGKDCSVSVRNLDSGTSCIESRADLAINASHVIKAVQQAEADGFDGVFVTDMDMCGVEASRQLVRIPVIGGYRASAYTAMMLSQRFAILTIANADDMQREHARMFGIDNNLATVLALPLGVYDLADDTVIKQMLVEYAVRAVREFGAEAITFGCTGFVAYAEHLANSLQKLVGSYIPVMDPNRCAINYLELLVRNKLSQSQKTYPLVQPNLAVMT